MSLHTKIAWADSTCNLVMGCSQSCELGPGCFARQWCQRFAGKKGYPKDFHKPELFLHRLADLRRWPDLTGKKRLEVKDSKGRVVIPAKPHLDGLPRLVFLSDMGEMFDEAFKRSVFLERTSWTHYGWLGHHNWTVLQILEDTPDIFIILTKDARRMAEFFTEHPCPPNLWLGVSVTDQSTLWRVDEMLKIDCKVKIVSHEPATGGIDYGDRLKGIAQLISGGQSGPQAAPCDLAWLRSDRDQAKAANCCWFMKQTGARAWDSLSRIPFKHPSGADPLEWPADLQNCREVPR